MPSIAVQADTVSNTIVVASRPNYIAINPAGTFAYVTHENLNQVSKINLATDTVTTTITVGSNPYDIAIDPSGTFAYVANFTSDTVSKINLATDTVVATITVESGPIGVAINPAGTFAYVANASFGTVSKINLATDTVTTTKTRSNSHYLAINPAGTFAYEVTSEGILKIDLATDIVKTTITVSDNRFNLPHDIAINPAGTFGYVTNTGSNTVAKIALTATDPQSITFASVDTQLLGTKTVALSAKASSTLAVALTSATPSVCTVSGSTVTMVKIGDCTINANQAGGSGFDAASQVSQTFTILPSPQTGEIGVSINSGEIFTNTISVKLDLVWPEYATSAMISNDGGFLASKTSTIQLAASVDWTLASSGSERLPKIVYVRFIKSTGNVTTFTDDIILDMTPPALTSATAVVSSTTAGSVSVLSVGAKSKSGIKLLVKASDANSGIGWIEVRTSSNSAATKIQYAKPKNKSQTFNLKTTSKSIQVRVLDLAGNTSKWKTVKVR